jgi:DNA-binding NarL/FixJ family response regulator
MPRERNPGEDEPDHGHEKDTLADLTPREREVLLLIALGLTARQIADVLITSPLTVRNHTNRIHQKLRATNNTYAVYVAFRDGIITIEEVKALDPDPGQ